MNYTPCSSYLPYLMLLFILFFGHLHSLFFYLRNHFFDALKHFTLSFYYHLPQTVGQVQNYCYLNTILLIAPDLKILSINCKGLNNLIKEKHVTSSLVQVHPDILCTQETQNSSAPNKLLKSSWFPYQYIAHSTKKLDRWFYCPVRFNFNLIPYTQIEGAVIFLLGGGSKTEISQ